MRPPDLIGGDYLRALRGADARRHSRARRQRRGGRAQLRRGRARLRDQSRPLSQLPAAVGAQLWPNDGMAEWMRRLHPLRLQYEMFSDAQSLACAAAASRRATRARTASRCPPDNPLLASAGAGVASSIETWLDATATARSDVRGDLPCRLRVAVAAGPGRAQGRRVTPRASDPARIPPISRSSRSGSASCKLPLPRAVRARRGPRAALHPPARRRRRRARLQPPAADARGALAAA